MPLPLLSDLQAAIVDLDGTMVDTQGDFVVALNLTLAELALPGVDRAFVERTVGKGSEHLLRSTLAQVGGDAALYDAAWAAYQRHYLAINGQHSDVYPGVVEGLTRLRAAGLRLACLTNKPLDFARPLLAAKGLDGFFELTFGGDSFARKKPDPMPLVETCRALWYNGHRRNQACVDGCGHGRERRDENEAGGCGWVAVHAGGARAGTAGRAARGGGDGRAGAEGLPDTDTAR